MSAAEEEARAAAYRASLRARASAHRARERGLAGSVSARKALADAWRPLTDALRERRQE